MRPTVALLALAFAAGCGAGERSAATTARTVTIEVGEPGQASGRGGAVRPEPDRRPPPDVPGDETCDGARAPMEEGSERAAEIAVRCLTNAVRRERDLDALRFDERLARAAATRSNDMVRLGYFSHDGPDGGNVERAARRRGYVPENRSWILGENIGWAGRGRATPAELMRGWLDSPTHRANILHKGYTEMGVGIVAGVPDPDADPGATVTQIFGATGEAARAAQTG